MNPNDLTEAHNALDHKNIWKNQDNFITVLMRFLSGYQLICMILVLFPDSKIYKFDSIAKKKEIFGVSLIKNILLMGVNIKMSSVTFEQEHALSERKTKTRSYHNMLRFFSCLLTF